MSTPEKKPRQDHIKLKPLRQLDPDRATIQVNFPTPSESEKHPRRQDDDGKPSRAETPRDALPPALIDTSASTFVWMLSLSIMSVIILVARVNVAHRWTSLMQTSGFVDWQQIRGIYVQIVVAAIPLIGLAVLIRIMVRWSRASRLWFMRELGEIGMWTATASIIGYVFVVIGWCGSDDRISHEMVKGLAKQAVASANFNRAYCQAQCQQSADGLAAFVRGECGPDSATAFNEIVGLFRVGDWCKEAIATQNFDVGATYPGTSPLGCLSGEAGVALAKTYWSDVLSFFCGLCSLALFATSGMALTLLDDAPKRS